MSSGWIGVDLDGTLAHYEGWNGGRIGLPVPEMVDRVKHMLDSGIEVRIFTARAYRWEVLAVSYDNGAKYAGSANVYYDRIQQAWDEDLKDVNEWIIKHIGAELPITCIKDYSMIALYDDRAKQVEPNTGRLLEDLIHCPMSMETDKEQPHE